MILKLSGTYLEWPELHPGVAMVALDSGIVGIMNWIKGNCQRFRVMLGWNGRLSFTWYGLPLLIWQSSLTATTALVAGGIILMVCKAMHVPLVMQHGCFA